MVEVGSFQQARQCALLCAGGTGGHLFPAHALASELKRRGFEVHLVSDDRIDRFAKDFPADYRHKVPSATFVAKSPIKLFKTLYALAKGYLAARRLISQIKPQIVVGFGGYPTVPPLLAAATKGVPTLIHEANAVLGRANRFLSNKVNIVACGLPLTDGSAIKAVYTGNPVRDAVLEAAKIAYPPPQTGDTFRITVFGGSQGAQFFSAVVLKAVGLLPEHKRDRLYIIQQAREDDQHAVRCAYEVMDIKSEVAAFFDDLPTKIAESHLVISRSGASTTAELAIIGRPSILVPYPYALDHDQTANAKVLAENNGGWVKQQRNVSPEWLAQRIGQLMDDGELLCQVAANAKAQGREDAGELLANAVVLLAEGKQVNQKTIEATT